MVFAARKRSRDDSQSVHINIITSPRPFVWAAIFDEAGLPFSKAKQRVRYLELVGGLSCCKKATGSGQLPLSFHEGQSFKTVFKVYSLGSRAVKYHCSF